MEISVQTLIEMVVVVLILKLIVSRWQPPLQESLQAIICIVLGTTTGYFFNPTKEGFIIGIIASGVAFYGGDLFAEFRTIKEDIKEELKDEDMKDILGKKLK